MHLIFLHGPAASGKLTTARALEELVKYPVFHNHLVVDLLTTVFPFGSEPFVRLREDFWLQVLTDAARIERSVIFTFAPEGTVAPGFPARARGAVARHGGRTCFVRLRVSPEEQERRIENPDRRAFHKLSDLETLRRVRHEAAPVEEPPVDLEIDTERLDSRDAAVLIRESFSLEPEEPPRRYPGTA